MNCCAVLYCAKQCCVVLCYTVLCCAVLCCAVLCCAAFLCCVVLCYDVVFWCVVLHCCAVLCWAGLGWAVLCYALLCCAVFCTVFCCALLCSALLCSSLLFSAVMCWMLWAVVVCALLYCAVLICIALYWAVLFVAALWWWILFVISFGALMYFQFLPHISGSKLVEPIGCYNDTGGKNEIAWKKTHYRAMQDLYLNQRGTINWTAYPSNTQTVINNCAGVARTKGYLCFGVQFWGECWSGENACDTYDRYGTSEGCVHGLGKHWANFVYMGKCGSGKPRDKLYKLINV